MVVVPVVPVIARKPVVVAPPEIVNPPACVPLPMVEEAVAMSPPVNDMRVLVDSPYVVMAQFHGAVSVPPVRTRPGPKALMRELLMRKCGDADAAEECRCCRCRGGYKVRRGDLGGVEATSKCGGAGSAEYLQARPGVGVCRVE